MAKTPLKTFRVLVTEEVTRSSVIQVQARDKEHAAKLALRMARNYPSAHHWDMDDVFHYKGNFYIGGSVEEAVDEVKNGNT